MSDQIDPATSAAPSLVAPAGLNLLGGADAGVCCGDSCALPSE
ncbi:hypothetical protein [Microbacterium sp. ZKA21]|jgi:hypothetical protein